MPDPVAALLQADYRRWIFPLRAALIFAKTDARALRDHIFLKILDETQPNGFVAGHLAYSRKDEHHLRRVLVLDPFAIFYLYDFIHATRNSFPKPRPSDRQMFGHSFHRGQPVDAFIEYHRFRRKKYQLTAKHGNFAHVDIFNCFNSFYHHDLVSFVTTRTSPTRGTQFGQFLRELNAGVSVACFPQGLYPAKAIGNAYLSFIETSRQLKVPALTRFLDDIVLFATSRIQIEDQLLALQYILDKHHLALNDSKTSLGDTTVRFGEKRLDRIKRSLVKKREAARLAYGGDDDEQTLGLSDREREYLTSLIRKPNVAQEDIELALTLMRDEPDAIELLIDPVLDVAPHLLRGLHRFIEVSEDNASQVWPALKSRLRSNRSFPEHDLFWYARILIDHFRFNQEVADLLIKIYEHNNASMTVKAAILETEFIEHGFADLKESALRGEGTLLLAASAMVGLVRLDKAKRNHVYKYVSRQSDHAAVLVGIARKMVV